MKNWNILNKFAVESGQFAENELITTLLNNRGIKTKKEIEEFLHPRDPYQFVARDVGIEEKQLKKALLRIEKAIKEKESVVVYADYDADGVTAGAIMWETLFSMGAKVMPFIPHRVEEGYGLSIKAIDHVISLHDPTLIITVDHGITGWEKVEYAKQKGIDIIITDHHVKPEKVPDCITVHTTQLCGAGVSWFVAKELLSRQPSAISRQTKDELLALAAIGTIADMVPLTGPNRSIAKFGLAGINHTQRLGLISLIQDAGLKVDEIQAYHVSHTIAPRLNAMGRIEHALDALRLLCTKDIKRAIDLSHTLGSTNRERQLMTEEMTANAKMLQENVFETEPDRKLIFIASPEYNPGVIGLVAGKMVETYYRPAFVISKGENYSKASARSISGFNIIEAIRKCTELLVDAGGHPMAAGFTVETKNLEVLEQKLQEIANQSIQKDMLIRTLKVDLELPFSLISENLWSAIQDLTPFGIGNFEPVFASNNIEIVDAILVGNEGKHLKLKVKSQNSNVKSLVTEAIGFGMGEFYDQLAPNELIDIAYGIDMNIWNGKKSVQLKLKDIKTH